MPEPLRIPGATPRTLLGYLVGLGLLRIVARQADADARACWRDGALELRCALDAAGLERFLLERWAPAPVVSPWNGGSGFFPPKDNTDAFEAIEADRSLRLVGFRTAIAGARAALRNTGLVSRPEPKSPSLRCSASCARRSRTRRSSGSTPRSCSSETASRSRRCSAPEATTDATTSPTTTPGRSSSRSRWAATSARGAIAPRRSRARSGERRARCAR